MKIGVPLHCINKQKHIKMSKNSNLPDKLETKLSKGIVMFHYRKVSDGTIRYAAGTCNNTAIPAASHSSATSHVKGDNQSYYDLGKQCWRTVKRSEILGIRGSVEV